MPAPSRHARVLPVCTALVLAGLASLPIANWIPDGRGEPQYDALVAAWLSGTAIAAGLGVVAALLLRGRGPAPGSGAWARLSAAAEAHPVRTALALAALAGLAYAAIATALYQRRPLLIDELVQSIQARIFTEGRLFRPAAEDPALFSLYLMVDKGGKVFAQFPPGWPAILALFDLVDLRWLAGPVMGAAAVLATAWWLRAAEPDPAVRLGAQLLAAASPFVAFQAASHMNHVPALVGIVLGMAGLAHVVRDDTARPAAAFASGLGFGLAATMRPVDAACYALPAAGWYLGRTWRRRTTWPDLAAAGLGVALPSAAMLWFNANTTGRPLLFGYTYLWGPSHSLGFHVSPWGIPHTPALGLELVNLYLLRLQANLFEAAWPSLLPAIALFALLPRLRPFDRYLLASGGLLLGAYFAYFHDGLWLGPRFVLALVPGFAWWTARLPGTVRARFGDVAWRGTLATLVAGLAIGAATILPIRARSYAGGLATMRWDGEDAARREGVRDALVFVRESWGAQVVARLWRQGIGIGETERIYKRSDLCALDSAVTDLEARRVTGAAAAAALQPLLADSSTVVSPPWSEDKSERWRADRPYGPRCRARIADDQRGFTLLGPLLLARDGNVYARDLHARDTLLLRTYPQRPVFLLRPASPAVGAPPHFERLDRDSLWAAARAGDATSSAP